MRMACCPTPTSRRSPRVPKIEPAACATRRSAHLVGYLPPVPQGADVLARVGYGETFYGIEVRPQGRKQRYHTDLLNLGAATQYLFDGANGLRVDYVRQELNVGRKQDVWAVAYTRRF